MNLAYAIRLLSLYHGLKAPISKFAYLNEPAHSAENVVMIMFCQYQCSAWHMEACEVKWKAACAF